jgi:hypothetical protein
MSVLLRCHCNVCPSPMSLLCLPFSSVQTLQWPRRRTDITMTSEKDRHYNDLGEGQTLQWHRRRTDITMTSEKDRHYNDIGEGQTLHWHRRRTDITLTSEKDRHDSDQKKRKKKDKGTNNDLRNNTQKTKYWATQTQHSWLITWFVTSYMTGATSGTGTAHTSRAHECTLGFE